MRIPCFIKIERKGKEETQTKSKQPNFFQHSCFHDGLSQTNTVYRRLKRRQTHEPAHKAVAASASFESSLKQPELERASSAPFSRILFL